MSINTLILIPTRQESDHPALQSVVQELTIQGAETVVEVCGFGPVEAAVGTAMAIDRHQPRRVILAGIAGSLRDDVIPGEAYCFQSVALQGVGLVREGSLSEAAASPFSQAKNWVNQRDHGALPLSTLTDDLARRRSGCLLTVCSTASTVDRAKERAAKFDNVCAEDMEGYAVALTCATRQIPLVIIRGISNHAGQSDHAQWKIDDALQSAAELLSLAVAQSNWDEPTGDSP